MKSKIALFLWFSAQAVFAQSNGSGVMPLPLREGNTAAAVKKAQPMPAQAGGIDQIALIQRYGTVIESRPLGAGGLTAWTVEKNGRRVVLYTTADSQAIISGVVWDSLTGRNLSDQFVSGQPSLPNVAPPAGGSTAAAPVVAPVGPALVGKYTGPVPESIKTIDSLAGIKEGSGGPADTLYVIFDPRCPYCRKAYAITREYVKRGYTIKWIPALALGEQAQGAALAATVLQAKQAEQGETLRRVLGNKEELRTQPSKATEQALSRNLTFFFAAFQNNGVGQAGVPAAFFLDKHTGKPRMMTGISEEPVIEAVFGKL